MAVAEQLVAVDPRSRDLRVLAEEHSPDEDAARRLLVRLLLHLPRLADSRSLVGATDSLREVGRLAEQESAAPEWLLAPTDPPWSPTELTLEPIDEGRARLLHERFHYLRSYRPGLHLAGFAGDRVAVLLTFSALDLTPLSMALPAGVAEGDALVLSRVYTTAWAPRNSLSRTLSEAVSFLRETDSPPRILLTYLNPGLGFDGASYKAANWSLFGSEHGTRYAYLDRSYVTDRELTRSYGTSDAAILKTRLGPRIAFSSMPLRPLEVFALGLNGRLRRVLESSSPRTWMRPWA